MGARELHHVTKPQEWETRIRIAAVAVKQYTIVAGIMPSIKKATAPIPLSRPPPAKLS